MIRRFTLLTNSLKQCLSFIKNQRSMHPLPSGHHGQQSKRKGPKDAELEPRRPRPAWGGDVSPRGEEASQEQEVELEMSVHSTQVACRTQPTATEQGPPSQDGCSGEPATHKLHNTFNHQH
ncbi:hypothetical protein AMECASPLE_033026 [Ameca splendens]|uniref:Uncharacterized protein n=1 Tax=Ameca splendens TaxID=208324 RepID=A0ABV0XW66_9TELE